MKSIFAGVSMLMLGAALAVGCGGAQDSLEETQTPAPAQTPASADPTPPSETPSSWTDGQTGKGKVEGKAGICCYVKCSKWHGPFPSVGYDNCANFGRYWCPEQGGGGYSTYKWDNC